MQTLGYYNGNFGPLEDMQVPMLDRAGYFGDGVYEATLALPGMIYLLDEHIDRLYRSAGFIRLDPPCSKGEMKVILGNMMAKMDDGEYLLYWQLSRGTALRSHAFPKEGKSNLWIMVKPLIRRDIFAPVQAITHEDTRFLHCNIKTLNLLPSVMYQQEADDNGCFEAILHRGDRVTECAHSNVHILKDGVFRTAPTDNLILPGIARAHLLKACAALGIPVCEEPFTVEDIFTADEVLGSSSTVLCVFYDQVDGKPVGGKDTELRLRLQNYVLKEYLDTAGLHA